MRKYQEYRDEARGMTKELCLLLAIAVTGTIVVSAFAVAAVIVATTHGYLSALTNIEMPSEHWSDLFLRRFLQASGLLMLTVAGTAAYKALQLAEGGGRELARSLGGTRVHGDATDPG